MFVLLLRLGFINLKLTAELEDLSLMAAFSLSSQSVPGDRPSVSNLTRQAVMTRYQPWYQIFLSLEIYVE
jgi:hypothetical protein